MYKKNHYTKLRRWEFWPWQILYIPIYFYYLWLALKARSFFFFFSANPGIETGGLLTESKNKILELIPKNYIPKTVYFQYPASLAEVSRAMTESLIHFPVICKPDNGERGWMVEKINDSHELEVYINSIKIDFILQEFVDEAVELGIFYVRMPDENKGRITSIVQKELLYVTGDGVNTISNLMKNNRRARLYLHDVEKRNPDILHLMLQKNERYELVPIGNHSRGATFLDGNHLITPELSNIIDEVSKQINGFYYGRFDIRCSGIMQLIDEKKFKILELNGAKSEPAHIYQPGYSILKAYKTLFNHWQILYNISKANHVRGYKYPSFRTGWSAFNKFLKDRKMRENK